MKGAIERVSVPTAEAEQLVAELDRFLFGLYPKEQSHGLSLTAIFDDISVHFFVSWLDGEAAGCGAVKLMGTTAEVKRMFVRPQHRGKGVAQRMLSHLEQLASHEGAKRLVLETGDEQIAAIALYKSVGFSECATFEPYTLMEPYRIEHSVFMAKNI